LETRITVYESVYTSYDADRVISAGAADAEMEGPWCYVDDIVKDPMGMEEGLLKIPEGPGFSVIVGEEKVDCYRIDF